MNNLLEKSVTLDLALLVITENEMISLSNWHKR